MNNNKSLIAGIVSVTVLIFAGLVWALLKAPSDTGVPSGPPQDENVGFVDGNDPGFGADAIKDDRVSVHLYGDFQCPACRAAEPGVRYAMQTYGDRVRFVWKDFPLEQIHSNARIGAEAARCAQDQGRFWDYHAALYDHQPDWSESGDPKSSLNKYAADLGLDQNKFQTCLDTRADDAKVQVDIAEGAQNGVDRTPTTFINRKRYYGMTPQEWDAAFAAAGLTAATSTTP